MLICKHVFLFTHVAHRCCSNYQIKIRITHQPMKYISFFEPERDPLSSSCWDSKAPTLESTGTLGKCEIAQIVERHRACSTELTAPLRAVDERLPQLSLQTSHSATVQRNPVRLEEFRISWVCRAAAPRWHCPTSLPAAAGSAVFFGSVCRAGPADFAGSAGA